MIDLGRAVDHILEQDDDFPIDMGGLGGEEWDNPSDVLVYLFDNIENSSDLTQLVQEFGYSDLIAFFNDNEQAVKAALWGVAYKASLNREWFDSLYSLYTDQFDELWGQHGLIHLSPHMFDDFDVSDIYYIIESGNPQDLLEVVEALGLPRGYDQLLNDNEEILEAVLTFISRFAVNTRPDWLDCIIRFTTIDDD